MKSFIKKYFYNRSNLLLFVFCMVFIVACTEEDTQATYDADRYAKADEEKFQKYFKTHYYNTKDGAIWTIGNKTEAEGALPEADQIPLVDDPKLQTIEKAKITLQDDKVKDYKMYYYITEEGKGVKPATHPIRLDSVLVKYTGMRLDSLVFDKQTYSVWFHLKRLVPGWGFGLRKFKPGILQRKSDGDYDFTQSGKGYIFIPSGLGYVDRSMTDIPKNTPLIFYIDLQNFKSNDSDGDYVPNYKEVKIDEYGNITGFDTDDDGVDDNRDEDDDGDGILTKKEVQRVPNSDGTYRIIYTDTDKDGVPDYLDYNPKKK